MNDILKEILYFLAGAAIALFIFLVGLYGIATIYWIVFLITGQA